VLRALLLLIIRLYWRLVPAERRKACLFRVSCSRYVYGVTVRSGGLAGLRALRARHRTCRPGYRVGWGGAAWEMTLVDGTVLPGSEVSADILAPYEAALGEVADRAQLMPPATDQE
jgi:uncharacterized protein